MERGLARGQPVGHGLVLLLDRRHHGLEPVDQRGHDVRLPLHQPERLFALVRTRERAQRSGDAGVERLRGLDPLAAAQRGKQAQHGRRGHAGDRCAERESQALDGRGQRCADGVEIRRAFERDAGAAQRRHHAQERAEHAQQYQQADEIRGQRRAGSAVRSPSMRRRAALAQARVQALQPRGKAGGRAGQPGDGQRQCGGGLSIALQFERPCQVDTADQQRDGQRQRIGARVADADPAHDGQACQENDNMDKDSGHVGLD